MSIKPILFNQEMVKAILEGKKTVTRRLVKPQPICYGPNITFKPHSNDFFLSAEKGWIRCRECGNDPEYSNEGTNISHHYDQPYQTGDILWVRETWSEGYEDGTYIYKASDKLADLPTFKESSKLIYHPSIHMPKEAARIFLKVTDVRVERLQDITEEQARKEGCYYGPLFEGGNDDEIAARSQFVRLWNSTVKNDLQKWHANPWVWVIEFERCEKPEGWC